MDRYGNAAERAGEEVLALAQSENYVEYNAQASAPAPALPAHVPPAAMTPRAAAAAGDARGCPHVLTGALQWQLQAVHGHLSAGLL